jgi:hypothetical protein
VAGLLVAVGGTSVSEGGVTDLSADARSVGVVEGVPRRVGGGGDEGVAKAVGDGGDDGVAEDVSDGEADGMAGGSAYAVVDISSNTVVRIVNDQRETHADAHLAEATRRTTTVSQPPGQNSPARTFPVRSTHHPAERSN